MIREHPAQGEPAQPTHHEVTLILPDGREVALTVGEDETILDAALAAGIDLPYMCAQGWCTRCAAKLIRGRVEHPTALRYYRQDADAGFVLLCSAVPRSDCLIETHQQPGLVQLRIRAGLPTPRG